MAGEPTAVWTPGDFADLASRAAIDKTLQRLEALGEMRRIDRGLYYRPTTNSLTARPTVPDYRAIVRAVARRDKVPSHACGPGAPLDAGRSARPRRARPRRRRTAASICRSGTRSSDPGRSPRRALGPTDLDPGTPAQPDKPGGGERGCANVGIYQQVSAASASDCLDL